MKKAIILAAALALTLAAPSALACKHLKTGKWYQGIGYGTMFAYPGQHRCEWRFSKVRKRVAYLDRNKSWCGGMTKKRGPKRYFGGKLKLKGCRIVPSSDYMVYARGETHSRTKGTIYKNGIKGFQLIEQHWRMGLRREDRR